VRPNEPARQVIATFDNYADAERVVDYLSDQRFEVNRVAIVGRELEYLEQVLSRLNYGGAALRGAGSRAIVGALFGLLVHALQRGQHDSTPSAGCGPSITTSSRSWRLPIVRCNSSPAATERNRRWRQR
jgi:hypothetical protein